MKSPAQFSRMLRAGAGVVLVATGTILGQAAQSPSPEPQKTTVTSDRLEARNTGEDGHYVFIENVHITGTNLEIHCDRLEIFTESKDGVAADSVMAEGGSIRRVLATGRVTINQQGRKATCGTVEILPTEDKIILTDSPIVSDISMGVTMKGTRMTYFRGERNIDIENPEVVGPALPNLGFPAPTDAKAPAPVAPPAPPAAAP